MESQMFDMCNVFCISTEAGKKIVVINGGAVSNRSNVIFLLCKKIVELEDDGCVVTGAVDLCPDGSRPRIKFRRTKEYAAAKKASCTVQMLTGKYAKLAKDLKAALDYGASKMGADDGGTCNFDSPTLYLPRWNKDKIKEAAKAAGLRCSEWKPYGRTFWTFSVPCAGQGYTRTNAAEAMSAYLGDIGYDAGMYYQAD